MKMRLKTFLKNFSISETCNTITKFVHGNEVGEKVHRADSIANYVPTSDSIQDHFGIPCVLSKIFRVRGDLTFMVFYEI